jgi:nucleotide-binding universal stress UspA family protein
VPSAPLTARLRDGSSIDIRPITPQDRERLRAGFERLSPESRYRRFFGPMPSLSERDLAYLTDVDHHAHEALLGIDPRTGEGVAVARFVRTGPHTAEPAIAVIDDWQGRGVGSELLGALVRRAREEGIARFEAPVLATNVEALRLLDRLGHAHQRRAGPEVDLTIDLPRQATVGSWAAVLRDFAAGALAPGRTLLELVWPRRPGSPDDTRDNVIVLATDGSEPDSDAVARTGALARSLGARVEVVAAHRFMVGDHDRLAADVAAVAADMRKRGIAAGEHVRRGDPALVITEVAAECNARLIVIGAGGPEGAWRRIVGTVADYVAWRTPCDLLIVRPRQPAPGAEQR